LLIFDRLDPVRPVKGHNKQRQSRALPLLSAALLLFAALQAPATAVAALPTEPGSHDGLFVVDDAFFQFAFLKHHGEGLAWRNAEADGAPDPDTCDHIQGLVRYPGPVVAPVFYVTQMDSTNLSQFLCQGGGGQSDGGYLSVVQFGSRVPASGISDGERLRSNLQQVGTDTEQAYPPIEDRWIRAIRFDGTLNAGGTLVPAYKHPGGPAIIDGYLLLPVDQPLDEDDPTGMIVVFDLTDPLDPQAVHVHELDHGIDNIGVTKRADDSYLLWTNGSGGEDINVYRTAPGADLGSDSLILDYTWNDATGLTGQTWPTGTGAHQSSTFVREPDGALFLIGTRHPGGLPTTGSDYADLYAVTDSPPAQISLVWMGEKHLYCNFDAGGGPEEMRICNLAAGGSTYVSPSGELILYGMPHDDEDGFNPDIVRMGEFRHRDVLWQNNPMLSSKPSAGGPYEVGEGGQVQLQGVVPEVSQPWFVELYDDNTYNDRSIVVDYQDRSLLELNNFNNLDGFNDKTSSVRWRLPVGVTAILWEDDNWSGGNRQLAGTGAVEFISDLDNVGFGDKTSSLQFTGKPPGGVSSVSWDLDKDGIFSETGVNATRGDEKATAPIFIANNVDGPDQLTAIMRVTPTVGTPTDYYADVNILNVAPELTLNALLVSPPGLGGEVELTVGIDDPGTLDKITLSIDWDDGLPVQEVPLAQARATTVSHTYVADQAIAPTIAVTADDGSDQTVETIRITIGPEGIFEDGFETN